MKRKKLKTGLCHRISRLISNHKQMVSFAKTFCTRAKLNDDDDEEEILIFMVPFASHANYSRYSKKAWIQNHKFC